MNNIIKVVEEFSLQEIEKNGSPLLDHFLIANAEGQRLVQQVSGDGDVVLLGTMLMDCKLGECIKEGKLKEHVQRSSQAGKKLLEEYNVDQETIRKVLNCIEAHHKDVPFTCKEAEIVANADCYRFLTPRGIFAYIKMLEKRYASLDEALHQVELKMDEKWNILSLPLCKKELEKNYKMFKQLIKEARSQ